MPAWLDMALDVVLFVLVIQQSLFQSGPFDRLNCTSEYR